MYALAQDVVAIVLGDYPIIFLGVIMTLLFCKEPWHVMALIPANVIANLALIMVMHKRVIGWHELEHFWLTSLVAVLMCSILIGIFIRTLARGPLPIHTGTEEPTP